MRIAHLRLFSAKENLSSNEWPALSWNQSIQSTDFNSFRYDRCTIKSIGLSSTKIPPTSIMFLLFSIDFSQWSIRFVSIFIFPFNIRLLPVNASHWVGYIIVFSVIFYCLCSPIFMSVFSSWTLIHLRHHRRQQEKKSHLRILFPRKHRYHQDYQLIKILVPYVLTNIICTLPFASIFLLHVSYHHSNPQLLLWIKTSILLCNCNHATSFYIYTLGTPIYRREVLRLLASIRRR